MNDQYIAFLIMVSICLSLISITENSAKGSNSNSSVTNQSAVDEVQANTEMTDYLLSLYPTQNNYIRKTEILGIGGGNWAIVVNGSVISNNLVNDISSVSGRVIDFTAVQKDDTVYETFVKTGEFGGFSVVFTPPSADIVTMTAQLADVDSTVQETASVVVSESQLPLIIIAILLGVAILILILYWNNPWVKKDPSRAKWGIFFTAIPIIMAYVILSRFPLYDAGGNSAIAAALITPIAGYLVELMRQQRNPQNP